ncbi:unknown [Clostridium sp. CAG:448]|nr:unknown [Clostridium sp. CAG:448]
MAAVFEFAGLFERDPRCDHRNGDAAAVIDTAVPAGDVQLECIIRCFGGKARNRYVCVIARHRNIGSVILGNAEPETDRVDRFTDKIHIGFRCLNPRHNGDSQLHSLFLVGYSQLLFPKLILVVTAHLNAFSVQSNGFSVCRKGSGRKIQFVSFYEHKLRILFDLQLLDPAGGTKQGHQEHQKDQRKRRKLFPHRFISFLTNRESVPGYKLPADRSAFSIVSCKQGTALRSL